MKDLLPIFEFHFSKEDALENHIEGLLFAKFSLNTYKSAWKRQWHFNDCLLNEVSKLGECFSKEQLSSRVCILKGIALLKTIYADIGSRFMSDCDLLVDPQDLATVKKVLLSRGFTIQKTSKWFANEFKIEFTKNTEAVEINVEVHTKLLYHHDFQKWNRVKLDEYYDTLSDEDHFLYLCSHLAFSHTFLKLFWLFDIYFLHIENTKLNYSNLYSRAKELKVVNSLKMVSYCLNKFFKTQINFQFSTIIYSYLFTHITLWKVHQSGLRYFLIKHLSKDSLFLSLKYDLFWALNKLKERSS
ncbi:nucleotidyltransferase family protein [Halobacteriovorax sp. HLS]|uniref:nucleotidyltransferase family protein n=1 Tax=Halobacteriovorax sp. HLS TaxID=2234000 RepID=UPI000FDBC292|nr:nucleotidyltransferase family protein [Halobacteriovorax sp. HLS]